MEAIRAVKLKIGVDPMGGAAVAYWKPIAARYGLDIEVVNPKVDPAFGFMTLDHDGIILGLRAAEITAVSGKDPGRYYLELAAQYGRAHYVRVDPPATPTQKARFKRLSGDSVQAGTLAGDPILAKLTRAPGNDAPIGGLKVTTAAGWFAARLSGTEDIYKLYAESFTGAERPAQIVREAQGIVSDALRD